jgi:hypothetical protein
MRKLSAINYQRSARTVYASSAVTRPGEPIQEFHPKAENTDASEVFRKLIADSLPLIAVFRGTTK